MQYREQRLVVDNTTLAADEMFAVIEPLWWKADIYNGERAYEESLVEFSRPQRLCLAIEWYRAEVNNGGHDQFYFNSTGIVWRDALAGFTELGLDDFAAVLNESANRLGGDPPLDREERQTLMDAMEAQFDDLDDRFYALEAKRRLDRVMLEYMRSRPNDFLFDGVVRKPD